MLKITKSTATNVLHVNTAKNWYVGSIWPADNGEFEFYMAYNGAPVSRSHFNSEAHMVNFLSGIRVMLER